MSDARNAILASIRRSLRRSGPLPAAVADGLEARVRTHPAHIRPAQNNGLGNGVGNGPGAGALAQRFRARLEKAGGTTDQVEAMSAVPAAVERHLAAHALARDLVIADIPAIEWPETFRIERRPARSDDRVAVTGALAGIAETGTVMMASSAGSPTTLCFLPDDHIVVLPAGDIVSHLEDAWACLRAGNGPLPRAVNLITGPSKTADVEQTLQTGAHGPRRFHVILVG